MAHDNLAQAKPRHGQHNLMSLARIRRRRLEIFRIDALHTQFKGRHKADYGIPPPIHKPEINPR
jgi:hypothetical protein